MSNADEVRDAALDMLAEHLPGILGPTREPRAKVKLLDIEAGAVLVEVEAPPYPGGEVARFRVRVLVEDADPEPCQYMIRPARLFLPPEPPEMCDEDAVPGYPYCRTHLEVAQ